MATPFTCSAGHQWELSPDAVSETDKPLCPRCGRPPLPDNLGEKTTLPPVATGDAVHGGETTITSPPTPIPSGVGLPAVPGYELLNELGSGGMGVVYRARHLRLGLPVALKMIRAGAAAGTQELGRFHTEARAVAALNHPGVVRLYDYGEHDGLPYFSMELVEGGNLADRLRQGPLPAFDAAALIEGLAATMQYVHDRGVIHRDLKPANVLFKANGAALIADFGLARRPDDDQGLTWTGLVMGTASYMAPEQAAGRAHEVDRGVDVYALGAVLYEALTGRPPFRAATRELTILQVLADEPPPPTAVQPDVPADLEAVCLKCLEKNPTRRYESAGALAADLRRFLAGEPTLAGAAGGLEGADRLFRPVGYEILELVAGGRTGLLFRARQLSLNRQVAVKLLPPRAAADPLLRSRFRREAEAIARLHHPHIVQIHDFGERGGQPYIIMEFVEGASLASLYPDVPLPFRKAASLAATLARAMHYAHNHGVIHSNLRPSCVMLTPVGEPKITRFGLARLLGEESETTDRGGARRLVSYTAPEQAEGRSREVGPATDVYGLGAILYQLLTGQPPFLGETLQATREQLLTQPPAPIGRLQAAVPPGLEAVCLRCLEKTPGLRFPSALALAVELERFQVE